MDDLVATAGVRHCISVLTTIEIRSAIRRLEGFNDISRSAAARVTQRLEAELAHLLISQVTAATVAVARQVWTPPNCALLTLCSSPRRSSNVRGWTRHLFSSSRATASCWLRPNALALLSSTQAKAPDIVARESVTKVV